MAGNRTGRKIIYAGNVDDSLLATMPYDTKDAILS
jgi:hypothetical protein